MFTSFNSLISLINTSIRKDNPEFITNLNPLNFKFISLLYQEGYISHFSIIDYYSSKNFNKKNNYNIILNKNNINCIISFYNPRNKKYISYNNLLNETDVTYILTTSKGLLTDKKAKSLKIGGQILAKIENK